MESKQETVIWIPLIGFDKEKEDRGVDEYYSTIGFKPDGVSLFVFCPDIVHYHDGMEQERVLPPDNCNYYGNVRSEFRDIQPWTNLELRELVAGLEARGAATYLGLMGVYVDRDLSEVDHYNVGHHEWLNDHKELMGVWTNGTYSLNVLKRFKDGSYYEDFFVEKLRETLKDYGFSGIHAADNFCPPGTSGSAKNGDYSDDMVGQFMEHTGLVLPAEITAHVDDKDRAGIQKRGAYIWNRYKQEWLEFLSWRWAGFWGKVARALHEDGKKVMVNNAWCSEPFEAVYRYGIDYKKLYEAGVDYIVAESVPTSVHAGKDETERYHFYDYMTMPAVMKTAFPNGRVLCLNGVKDATEEWATINHFTSECEREIYSLTNFYLQTSGGLQRAMDGMMPCLGDGLTNAEWAWLRERYDVGYSETPERVLTPTVIWSDAAHDKFLPDYIETKRWSLHKTVYEIAKSGGQAGAFARIEDLRHVTGPIFVPNIDLLDPVEIRAIADYKNGSILCTSLVERHFQMPIAVEPDIHFADPVAEYKLCLHGYGLGYIDFGDITSSLGEDSGMPDIVGSPRYVEDPAHWRADLIFRKVSSGFVKACAKLIRSQYAGGLAVNLEDPFMPQQLKDGRIRVFLGNDNRTQYRTPMVRSERRLARVVSHSKFPVLPSKMLDREGRIIIPKSDKSHESVASYGFITKIPPGGMTILDIEFAES